MKELAPHGGSLQSINKSGNGGSDPSIPAKMAAPVYKMVPAGARPTVATNKGFLINPTVSPASSIDGLANGSSKSGQVNSNMSTSKSYTTGLNKYVLRGVKNSFIVQYNMK